MFNFWRKTENEKIIKLIKKQPKFFYDKSEIKTRLLSSINNQPRTSLGAAKISQPAWFRMPSFGIAFAAIILAIGLTSTLAYADSAKPGDKLFGLDLMQEDIVIKLVPSQPAKARLRAKFVNERGLELEQLVKIKNHKEIKVEAVGKSVKGLNQAIESVSEAKVRSETRGKTRNAQELGRVLNRLENLADQHEQQAKKIRTDLTDPQLQEKIDSDIKDLREAKMRVRLEIDNSGPGSF